MFNIENSRPLIAQVPSPNSQSSLVNFESFLKRNFSDDGDVSKIVTSESGSYVYYFIIKNRKKVFSYQSAVDEIGSDWGLKIYFDGSHYFEISPNITVDTYADIPTSDMTYIVANF